jgi:hypothetical protein
MTMRTMLLATLTAFALVAVPIAAGQGSERPPHTTDPDISSGKAQRALSSARKTWRAQGVPNYTFLLSVNCFCPPTTSVKIVVRRGIPTKATPKALLDQATAPRLFRTIQTAIDDKVANLVVTYGKRGVPRSIYIDRDERIADEEIGYIIRGFAPLKR